MMVWLEQRREELFDLLGKLVAVPSLAGDEWRCQEIVSNALQPAVDELDIWEPDVAWLETQPAYFPRGMSYAGRPNVVGIIAGAGNGHSLIMNAHVDVVDPGPSSSWRHEPWSGAVVDGVLHGRGSADDKASLAAMIFVARCWRDLGLRPAGDVILESVVDEEWGGGGTLATLARGYHADAAIAFEPTGLAICPASRGGQAVRVTVAGKGAHPIRSYEGVSALEKAIPLLQALKELEGRRQERLRTELFRPYPIFVPIVIGKISADEWPSKVPEKCVFEGLVGYSPDEMYQEARDEIEAVVAKVAARDPWLQEHPPTVEWHGLNKEGAQIPVEHPFVQTVSTVHQEVVGTPATIVGFPAGCDLPFLVNQGRIPSLVFGPGDLAVAHTSHECIPLAEVLLAAKMLALIGLRWCGETGHD